MNHLRENIFNRLPKTELPWLKVQFKNINPDRKPKIIQFKRKGRRRRYTITAIPYCHVLGCWDLAIRKVENGHCEVCLCNGHNMNDLIVQNNIKSKKLRKQERNHGR